MPYGNKDLHFGHVGGVFVQADVFARFLRDRIGRENFVFVSGTILFVVLNVVGGFQGFHYSESVTFCGETCHTVMKPEYVAYQNSPHARVACAACHVGSGADWYVKSKLSGSWQVVSVAFDLYPRPIPVPVENLRPARETCEQCHWPAHFYNEKLVVHDYFGYEEDNTHWKLHLLMKIGGGGEDGGPEGSASAGGLQRGEACDGGAAWRGDAVFQLGGVDA